MSALLISLLVLTSIYSSESAQCRSLVQDNQAIGVLDVCFTGRFEALGNIVDGSQLLTCNDNKDGVVQQIYLNANCAGPLVYTDDNLFNMTYWDIDCDSSICSKDIYAKYDLYLGTCTPSPAAEYAQFGFVTGQCTTKAGIGVPSIINRFTTDPTSVEITCTVGT